VAFTDVLPAGLDVVDGSFAACGGTVTTTAATRTIALTGATIAGGGTCTFSVTVMGVTEGTFTNTTGNVTSANGGTGNTASATITVLNPPSIAKAFSPNSIPVGGTSTLTFTIMNLNSATPLADVAFTDVLPAGLSVADGSFVACGGTVTTTAATRTITLTGASIAAGGTCTFTVTVGGVTAGVHTNTTGNVTSSNAGTGNAATAVITVVGPPSISKAFSPTTIAVGETSTLTFNIANANTTTTLTGVGFTDVLPAGVSVADGSFAACGGTVTTVAATRTITLTGATIAAGGTCTFDVTVTGATPGSHTNTTGNVTSVEGGTGNTATAVINVVGPPSIAKVFSPTSIPIGGTSTLTFTITNNNPATTLTGVAFTDVLPTGISIANGSFAACGGTVTTVAATRTITLTGATIAGGGTCTFGVTVTGVTEGTFTNTTGNVTSANGGTGNTASADITVIAPPSIAKAFSPNSIPEGGTSTLTFTIMNTNAATTLNGVSFIDVLPAGLSVADGSFAACGGTVNTVAATRTITLSGATIVAGGTCTFSVTVGGAAAGVHTNTTGNVTSSNGGTGNTATAVITVVGPPSISKAFSPNSIAVGGTSTLTFNIANANTTTTLTGVAFTDVLPAGVEVADGSFAACGGTVTTVAATRTITLTGASIAAGGTCTFSVTVTGSTAGVKVNVTGNVTSANGGTGNAASATLTVVAPPSIAKAFSPTSIPIGGTSTLTFTITNPNPATALTGVAFTDVLPAGLSIADGVSAACGGTVTTVAATRTITLTGASIAGGGTCTFSVTVTGTTEGVKNNVTGNVTSVEGGTGNTASATITVVSAPTFTKAFGAATIPVGGTTSLTFTITNTNAATNLTGVAFTDVLPAGLEVANSSTSQCGGTLTTTAATRTITLTGATIAPGATCTFSVTVTGSAPGVKNNVTGNISTNESGPGGTATASITVIAPPSISKAFGAATIPLNGTTTLTFTINNPNSTESLTGVAFTDVLPNGLSVANGSFAACGGTVNVVAATRTITLTGATIAANGTCTFSVTVTGITPGTQTNVTGNVTSANGGTGNTATASVVVVSPPNISKAFGAATIPLNGTTTLTFTINNMNKATMLTGVGVVDVLPAGLDVANGSFAACGGTVTTVAATRTITLTGASIAAGGTCTFTVTVTGTTVGLKVNVTGNVTSANGGTGNTATASIQVNSPPVAKCKNVTVSAGPNCTANASINDGSFDPDPGDTITVVQSPAGPYPLGNTTVTLTVTDNHGSSSTCTGVVTVVDTTPPVLNCPSNIGPSSVIPVAGGLKVTYPTPVATDNCPNPTVVCVPPSGSIFPVGTTTVTCTATDAGGNTAVCTFTVTTFDICLQDETNPGVKLLLNSFTGDYIFCCNGQQFTGRGTAKKKGQSITFQHIAEDRRLNGTVNLNQNSGTANLQAPPGQVHCQIVDRDIRNNTCSCAVQPTKR
jgi:uncharacterized repeat protein (TIGR01451 family)